MSKIVLLTLVLLALVARVTPSPTRNDLLDFLTQPTGGRIVGGQVTSITKHPHQVALRRRTREGSEYRHSCGGSIYSARIIVTAAHCVYQRLAKDFLIVAGTNNRRGSDGAVMRVKEIIVHEKYIPAIFDFDIAIMILEEDLPFNNVSIRPIALASVQPASGTIATVTGWGALSSGGASPEVLMEVDVPIVGFDMCNYYYGDVERITESMLCAGVPEGGLDACQGDSGGPLIINSQLAGVVSWGRGCALPFVPGVYANVAYLYDWLESTISAIESHIDFL